MKKWIIRGLSLVLLLTFFYFLFACGKKNEEMKLVSATRGDIREKALAVGTIEPEKEIRVKSIIPGIVAEVLFKVGDAVKLGAPLFKISPNPTPLEYVEARRNMELAEVTTTGRANSSSIKGTSSPGPKWTPPRAPTGKPN
jgi:HlyD family secretion protein